MRELTHHPFAVGLAILLALVCSAAAVSPLLSIAANEQQGELEVRFRDRKLLVYAFATNQFKPYVRELYTLRGENVLRDAPPDHLHHHGMMYAVWLNGINFWEENSAAGVEKHAPPFINLVPTYEKDLPTAYFVEVICWLAPTNRATADYRAAALVFERRKLTVTVDEENEEVALRWDSEFGPVRGKMTVAGPNYVGLGLRLPEAFNHVAKFQNSANEPYFGQNSQNVIPARWTSVSGAMDGHEVMLVMFGRPDNARGDASFFTMLDPFAYLSATQGLDNKPLQYSFGDNFKLSYLLTVYTEYKSPQFINRRYERWAKERR
jgi:hypothetical protein